jgi:hypothetical protein
VEKTLIVRPMRHLTQDAISAFEAAQQRFDTSGGLVTLGELLQGAISCEVLDGETPVAWFAVRSVNHMTANECELLIAAGAASVDLTRNVLPYIEAQVSPADALTIYTRRQGLVRKLLAQGYRVDGTVLRKTLGRVQ